MDLSIVPKRSWPRHTFPPTLFSTNNRPLPSPSSYIRTNSILIQTNDGRKLDSGIIKQQIQFDFNDLPSTSNAYSSPYYNYERRKNRYFLKPILAVSTIISILVYFLLSEKMQLLSFSLAKSPSSDRIPKLNDANLEVIGSSSSDTDDDDDDDDDVMGNSKNYSKNKEKIKTSTADADDDELRGMEDDDAMNNMTLSEVIAYVDVPGDNRNYTADYMNKSLDFDHEMISNSSGVNYNTTAITDGDKS